MYSYSDPSNFLPGCGIYSAAESHSHLQIWPDLLLQTVSGVSYYSSCSSHAHSPVPIVLTMDTLKGWRCDPVAGQPQFRFSAARSLFPRAPFLTHKPFLFSNTRNIFKTLRYISTTIAPPLPVRRDVHHTTFTTDTINDVTWTFEDSRLGRLSKPSDEAVQPFDLWSPFDA